MKEICILCTFLLLSIKGNAQFSPAVGEIGTTAVYKDSSIFIDWANHASLLRGFQDISNVNLGLVNIGDSSSALGQAGSNGVVSLGDGGHCILQFSTPITNKQGADFAVFENGFNNTFLELACVEVSSDGSNFFRFPAISNTDTTLQVGPFDAIDASKINNLAGKYRGLYGTPFDLDDVPDNLLLNKYAITHIKVIDVVGSIQKQYCTRDANKNIINDPWPTAFGSGGFDLDAVGVIHNQLNVGINELTAINFEFYPNPAADILYVNANEKKYSIKINSLFGDVLYESIDNTNSLNNTVDLTFLNSGTYYLTFSNSKKQTQIVKLIKL